ncbi:MAG: M48 family metallopeptidase, partial [Proteobacteria bacterium]|nr:M48 family metallopeptidase [Pseudomonadota bacterium]
MQKIFIFCLFLISACTSTTLKTDSDVTRKQFVILPEFMALSMANEGYQQAKQKALENKQLNQDVYLLNEVRKISYRLIDEVRYFRPDAADWKWEVNLQTSDEINAYCMPGGKIMVFTGLIDKAAKTNDEIAAVVGHEIAHALREHGRERMSTALVQQLGILGFAIYISDSSDNRELKNLAVQGVALGTTLFFALPNSREQEREADKIGLELAARAGYNPLAAVSLWRKMDELSDLQPPEFL